MIEARNGIVRGGRTVPKNIVVCCDGTSNQFGPENTNVLRLYSVLERDPRRQATFYDPGVGTFSAQPMLTQAGNRFQRMLGLAFGRGLTKNVLEAYAYLMQNWEPGDRIFLFGFSRGAYTVRVLAGMIHKVGLLHADNGHLVQYADRMFKREINENIYSGFKRTFARDCRIHFLGLWDTVSSVGWVWDPVVLPNTATNSSVEIVRHAIAIDERRAFFKQNLWNEHQDDVDLRQVWFAGCHSDVGGANLLAKLALEWMLVEATEKGLIIDANAAQTVLDEPMPPDAHAPMVESLKGAWRVCEYFPKLAWNPKKKKRRPRVNRGRPRWIADDAIVHESALMRHEKDDYNPSNFPTNPVTEPWKRFADTRTGEA
jgi:uncharacterized protein (DUF2235 family)